jgi:hypothetical protein
MRAFASQDILFKPTHRSHPAPALTDASSLYAVPMPAPFVHETSIAASEDFARAVSMNGPEWTPAPALWTAPRMRRRL